MHVYSFVFVHVCRCVYTYSFVFVHVCRCVVWCICIPLFLCMGVGVWCVHMYSFVFMHMCRIHAHVCTCVWKPEINIKYLILSLSILLIKKQGLPSNLELTNLAWLLNQQAPRVLLSLFLWNWACKCVKLHPPFYVSARDLNPLPWKVLWSLSHIPRPCRTFLVKDQMWPDVR